MPHQDRNFTVNVIGLQPGTKYEVRTVSVVEGGTPGAAPLETKSDIIEIETAGESELRLFWYGWGIIDGSSILGSTTTTAGWFIAIVVAVIILVIILIIVCLVVRNRGAKYPGKVSLEEVLTPVPPRSWEFWFGSTTMDRGRPLNGPLVSVSEKEKEQGREPMLKDERGFSEYAKQ